MPKLGHFIESKLAWKGRFLVTSAVVGLVNSFVASIFLAKSIRNSHENMLKKEVFPAWFSREQVINPDRVFFELDDTKHNEPTIWHAGMYFIWLKIATHRPFKNWSQILLSETHSNPMFPSDKSTIDLFDEQKQLKLII